MPTAIHPFISISKVPVLISVTFEIIARGKRTKKKDQRIFYFVQKDIIVHISLQRFLWFLLFLYKMLFNSVGLSVKRFMLI